MDGKETSRQHAEKAAHALCDLNHLYAVIALCEASLFRTKVGNRFADKVVVMARDAAAKQLRTYDSEMGKL